MGGASHTVHLAHDHRHPGHSRLHDRKERRDAVANRGRLLSLGANHEPRLIDQAHDGQVKGVAEVHQPSHLLCAFRRHCACVPGGIVGHDAHRLTLEAREAGDLRRPIQRGQLKERALVDDALDHPTHVVGLAAIARHNLNELRLLPVAIVLAGQDRRRFPDVSRQIAQEAPNLGEDPRLIISYVVDNPAAQMDLRTAEFFLVDGAAEGALDERRTTDHHLRRVPGHDREVRSYQTGRG